jgi:hypothetical protein
MKITWFAGTTIRIHIGGQILVADADHAPVSIDRTELVSGADRVFALAGDAANLPLLEPAKWRPRPLPKAIDETPQMSEVALHRLAEGSVLVDAPGEPPLVLATGQRRPPFGRWADAAVVVLFGAGDSIVANGTLLLAVARPRLIALAAEEAALDTAIGELRDRLEGAALVSLEPGMALEV